MEKDCIHLTSEEKERLIEFKKSDKFLKAYKQIKEEIGLEERKKLYFRLKVLFCLFLLVKFFPLGIYLSFFAFIIFMTYAVLKEEKKSSLVDTYTLGILNSILQILDPNAEICVKGDFVLNEYIKVVPDSYYYALGWMFKYNDDRCLKVCDLRAWHEVKNSEHDTNPREVTDFRGLLYGLILPHSYAGQLRVVPTKKSKFLKKEIQGRYLEALEGERKIDVEDVLHNENFNIYCTDEVSARKFLNPSVLAWFDQQISKQGLSLYLKENKLFISVYQDHYLFQVPYTQKMLDAWSVEKAALSLKELNQEIRDTVGIFYQLSM